jgi:hypothetical protein
MNDFDTPQYPQFANPAKVIDNPKWKEVRAAAKAFLNLLSR